MPLFLNSGMNTAFEDESGKDAVLFQTNYSRLRHRFPILLRTILRIEQSSTAKELIMVAGPCKVARAAQDCPEKKIAVVRPIVPKLCITIDKCGAMYSNGSTSNTVYKKR